jgi:hypothetical protein
MSIFDLLKTEARIFKYGSGTGTNFSRIRGKQEKLSGGGTSSGLMSFLEVLDKGAGATKSGGTTRRAAKMVCLDMDHPEIRDFINWKVREESKARVLIEHGGLPADFNGEAYHTVSGQNSNNSVRVADEFMQAALEGKTGRPACAPPVSSMRNSTPPNCSRKSARPPGPAPIPASSSTAPSTSGTPAPTATASTPPTPAPNTCSSTTRPATCRRSTS